ncbi:MAG: hypothetical protein R3F14_34965 [Polyangiaceae bacterium]
MRRFVIFGQRAGLAGVLLDDLPSTSGRLDVLLRCVRAAFLVSHGLRRDTVVYLVLLGGPRARTVRVDGTRCAVSATGRAESGSDDAKGPRRTGGGAGFVEARPGFAVAEGGLSAVIEDLVSWMLAGPGRWCNGSRGSGAGAAAVAGSGAGATAVAGSGAGADAGAGPMSFFVLEEGGPDVREAKLAEGEPVFFRVITTASTPRPARGWRRLRHSLGLGPVRDADDAVVPWPTSWIGGTRRQATRRAGEGTAQETESSSPAHQA